MAERKIKSRSWLLYASDDEGVTQKVIACLTSKELASSNGSIDASSDCGNEYLPGDLQEQSFAIEGFTTLGATATKVSTSDLYTYWKNGTTFQAEIRRATEVAGDLSYSGNVFVSELSQNASDNEVVTFTATLTVAVPPLTQAIAV
jgi:hypothetical protein